MVQGPIELFVINIVLLMLSDPEKIKFHFSIMLFMITHPNFIYANPLYLLNFLFPFVIVQENLFSNGLLYK